MLAQAAEAARSRQEQIEKDSRDKRRDELVANASTVFDAAMVDPDGETPVTADLLEVVHAEGNLVVFSDGELFLSVVGMDVRLVEKVGPRWTKLSEPLRSLAELADVLDTTS